MKHSEDVSEANKMLEIEGIMLFFIALYFTPTIVAICKSHRKTGAILVVNLFLGWTFLGWVLALAWAVINDVD